MSRSVLGLLVLAALVCASPASAQTGLVAAYGFNEGSGTTTADASGNANTGTLSGATWSSAGRSGGAIAFNGTGSLVTVPASAVLNLTGAMTLEAWVNASSLGAWESVLMKESSGGLSYALYASDTASHPSGYIRRTADIDVTGPSALAVNTWVHLATTYNGSSLILYINGSQVATKAMTGSIVTSTQPFRIGGNSVWGEYFSGLIDEVRVYNRALTASEVQTDMNTPVAPATPAAPDFSITAAPGSASTAQAGSATYSVTVGSLNGFAGTVNLSATGLPSNATASFSPSSVTGSGSAILIVTTAGSTPTGTSTLAITGTSGTLTRSASASLTVTPPPDFAIAMTPASASVLQGASASYAVTVSALNGFAGTVNLSAAGLPANATGSFSPVSLAGGGSATLSVATTAATPTGTSTITVTGTSGVVSHAATASLAVSATSAAKAIGISFVGTGTAMASSEIAGVVPKANWNNAAGSSRATALPLVDETGARSGASVTWTANGTSRTTITDVAGNARMMRGYLDTSNTSMTTVTVSGLIAAAYDVYVYVDGNNGTSARTGAYRISGAGITTTTINATDAASTNFGGTFTQATNSNGNYVKFSIVASGFTLSATPVGTSGTTRRAPLNGVQVVPTAPPPPPAPDFAISVSPGSQSVVQGSTTTYTVTTTALNGFANTVDLSVGGLPAGATGTFAPPSIAGAGSSVLTVTTASSTPTATSTLSIVGASGALLHSGSATLFVTGLTYTVSGVVTPATTADAPVLGAPAALVTLQGTVVKTTTVDGSGAYLISGVPNGIYLVTPSKSGFTFSPTNRSFSLAGSNVAGVDFVASVSPNAIAISAPAAGASVSNAFSISASASASIVGVQFQVDGANVGAEDTSAPYSTPVTVPSGGHTLTAVGRDANGNTVTSAPVTVTASGGAGTALTIDGTQTFQTMDGFGVNINSLSWKNGELAPALDRLIAEVGVKTWRVVFDMTDWEAVNDNADPNAPNWAGYYNTLYSSAKFQNLWGTLHYLNQKGVTSGIIVSFMGQVPGWMGGTTIQAGFEDEFVEMVATVYSYAKNTEHVQFDMIDPINEPDWDGFEGPQVGAAQYVSILQKLAARLDAMGLSDLRFVGPSTAQVSAGVDTYMPQIFANTTVMNKIDHFGLHNYAGQTGGADAKIKQSTFPPKNFWMTELAIPEEIFTMINQGAAGAQIWDAYDSVYYHAILAGAFYHDGRGSTPPNDAGNLPALMSYDVSTGAYAARPQFYQMATFRYVTPGSVRIAAIEGNSSLTVYAFRHVTTGRITIIGRNTGSTAITLAGSLGSAGLVGALQLYQTSSADGFGSFTRGADAVVTAGAFVATIPANSFFTLTGIGQ